MQFVLHLFTFKNLSSSVLFFETLLVQFLYEASFPVIFLEVYRFTILYFFLTVQNA